MEALNQQKGTTMLAVSVYAVLSAIGFILLFNHFIKNGIGREYPTYESFGGLVAGTVFFVTPMYWWIIASVGWGPATVALVIWGSLSFLWALVELLIYGRARVVFWDAVFSTIIQTGIVWALFGAASLT